MASSAIGAQQYLGTQVGSSTPVERVVLMYDASIRWIDSARDALARRDIPSRREALSRALAIVAELQQSLDLERGGAVAEELDRLYIWITERLTDAIVQQDARPLDEVVRILKILADAWRTVASGPVPEPAR